MSVQVYTFCFNHFSDKQRNASDVKSGQVTYNKPIILNSRQLPKQTLPVFSWLDGISPD